MRPIDIDSIKFDAKGLVPVIAQDFDTKAVLMLAYANKESLLETQAISKLVFFSRSRQERWLKGETSGNYLELIELIQDCDNDTVLAMVRPLGPACHNGTTTCFEEREDARG
jgi:phosphoribosyl-ATP pyrophosphohydrolase/phosphoribosyl-AMP cyclohydrolase